MGSYRTYLSLVKLQQWFLGLQWKTTFGQNCNLGSCVCSERLALGQNTLMMMMMMIHKINKIVTKNVRVLSIFLKCTNTYKSRWARWLKRQGAELRAGRPGFDPGCRRGGDFSSLLRVQTGPGVHSTSYKMSTGEFPRG